MVMSRTTSLARLLAPVFLQFLCIVLEGCTEEGTGSTFLSANATSGAEAGGVQVGASDLDCTPEDGDMYNNRWQTKLSCCAGLREERIFRDGQDRFMCTPIADVEDPQCTAEDEDQYDNPSGTKLQCCEGLRSELIYREGQHRFICLRGTTGNPDPGSGTIQADGTMTVMSYNLFGWNAFNRNRFRADNVIGKINYYAPVVLGAQEVEQGQGVPGGFEYVKGRIESEAGFQYAGGNIFYKTAAVELLDQGSIWVDQNVGRSMGWVHFRQRGAEQRPFLFFNTHWHNHGNDDYWFGNARDCAEEIARVRAAKGGIPALFSGDFNVFAGSGVGSKAVRYLTGEVVDGRSSPAPLDDTTAFDRGSTAYGHKLDYVFASQGEWRVAEARVDREGMNACPGNCPSDAASDHAAIVATLRPTL